MNVPGFLAIVTLLALQPASGRDLPKLPCGDKDQQCAHEAIKGHVASRLDTWKTALSQLPGDRIGPAPPPLVEYLNLDNILNGYPDRPITAKLDADLLADVNGAVADLPAKIWNLFGDRLVGLYFVEGLGGTGYTDYVFDAGGKPVAAFVVFDAAILTKLTANAWASWKENTPFKAGSVYRLDARIEAEGDDNRKNAIQYILLHELGHVLSVGANIHPPWNISPKNVARNAKYPFLDLSWKIDRKTGTYQSIFDPNFPQRARTVYYFGAKLSAADMVPTYMNLEQTNFPSLYAATRPGDDFAESFVSYVHVVLMKRPWQISIFRNGKVAHVFKPCWGELRCAKKQEFLRQLLGRDP